MKKVYKEEEKKDMGDLHKKMDYAQNAVMGES